MMQGIVRLMKGDQVLKTDTVEINDSLSFKAAYHQIKNEYLKKNPDAADVWVSLDTGYSDAPRS
jgi:hypothetical protein